jgi:hypothetical protein
MTGSEHLTTVIWWLLKFISESSITPKVVTNFLIILDWMQRRSLHWTERALG